MITSEKLTRREKDTLEFINSFISQNGYSPSFAEIRNGLGVNSNHNVSDLIERLSDKGYIRIVNRTCRSITLIREVLS